MTDHIVSRLALALAIFCGVCGCASKNGGDDAEAFNLATFNIRYLTSSDAGDKAWSARLPRIAKVVSDRAFDVFGVQEATRTQRDELLAALPSGWAMVGEGRDRGGDGEASCIFYKTGRFACEETEMFWLSETPRVSGSKSWGAACPRVCTFARLRDRRTGRTLRYYNTHLDHRSEKVRREGMKTILAEIGTPAPGEAVVVTGDLNDSLADVLPGDAPVRDSLLATETPHEGPQTTFHGYGAKTPRRIDYVLVSDGVRVLRHVTCDERPDGKFPSDHDAVMVRLVVGGANARSASVSRGVTILDWNIRTGRGLDEVRDLGRVASVIKGAGADFVGLQEVDRGVARTGGVDQLAKLAELTGMAPSWGKAIDFQGGEYGVALLSRMAPLRTWTVPLTHPEETEPRVLLLAEFEDFFVGVTHLSARHEAARLASPKTIRDALPEGKPCFLMGDWNARPESDVLKAMRETFEILSGSELSFPANAPTRCIDYIAVTRRDCALCEDVSHEVLPETVASDHRPVRVRLRFACR